MKISLGPILSFRGVTTAGWSLSALIVTDILSNPPELILQTGNRKGSKRKAKLLKAFPETNPTSKVTTDLVEQARRAVLRFFNAPVDEWVVIFTANASQALKLVGESYPFGPKGEFLLTFDNHNSVNGIREFARARGNLRRMMAGEASPQRTLVEIVRKDRSIVLVEPRTRVACEPPAGRWAPTRWS